MCLCECDKLEKNFLNSETNIFITQSLDCSAYRNSCLDFSPTLCNEVVCFGSRLQWVIRLKTFERKLLVVAKLFWVRSHVEYVFVSTSAYSSKFNMSVETQTLHSGAILWITINRNLNFDVTCEQALYGAIHRVRWFFCNGQKHW